jgi:hypothetical protein
VASPLRSPDPRFRLFDVECECGEQFRVSLEVPAAESLPDGDFLVPPSGKCPWCGLRLEEIELFGAATGPRRRS